MPSPGRLVLAAAAGMLLASAAHAQGPRLVPVTVTDHLSPGQQEETIEVYFQGVLAGTLHVDQSHPDDAFDAKLPALPKLQFTLCGRLLREGEDGQPVPHPIDNGGTITGFDGAVLAAITLGDVLFTFHDETGHAAVQVERGPACNAAVS